MLPCQQVLDRLSDYVDGQLSPGELTRLDEHLAMCPECADYAASFHATVAACRSLRHVERERRQASHNLN